MVQVCPDVDPTTGPHPGLGSSYHASDSLACHIGPVTIRFFSVWSDIPPVPLLQRRIQRPIRVCCIYLRTRIPRAGHRLGPGRDHLIQAARMKADGLDKPKPEHRLLLMMWLSPCVALGLFIYGSTAYYKVHWIVPIIGTFFIGLGACFVLASSISSRAVTYSAYQNIANFHQMPTQLYLIELFGSKGAPSALSAMNVLRYMGGTFCCWLGRGCIRLWVMAGATLCLDSSRCCLPCLLFCFISTASGFARVVLSYSKWA